MRVKRERLLRASPRSVRLDPRYSSLILDSVSQGIFTINARSEITTFYRAA